MRLYVVRQPDSEVGVITNSSSMIYVARRNADIESILVGLDDIGAIHWMGEPRQLTTSGELLEFCNANSHVLRKLFSEVAHIPELDTSFMDEESCAAMRVRDDARRKFGEDSEQYKLASEKENEVWRKKWQIRERASAAYATSCASVIMQYLPITYFAAGEDNEINYEVMCQIEELPLNGARLS